MRETLRSALSTAVRQDRLIRNVARYGGGVANVRPPVDRFTDHELALIVKAARGAHFFPVLLLLARTGLRIGEACGLRWRDLNLGSVPPRLTVVSQLDRWGELVHPRPPPHAAPSRCDPRSPPSWRRGANGSNTGQPTASTTPTGWCSPPAPDGRSINRASVAPSIGRTAAGVDHGSLKTFRSTVATQLADAGLHPSRTQAFLGHAHPITTMTYYTAVTDIDEAADLLSDLD